MGREGSGFSFLEGINPIEGSAAALALFRERGIRGDELVEGVGRVPIEGIGERSASRGVETGADGDDDEAPGAILRRRGDYGRYGRKIDWWREI